jgi:hypothetical protein
MKEKKAVQGSLRNHGIRGMCQRFNASIAGRWDIIPHNDLTNMRKKRRRSTMHMQLMLKNANPRMKNLYSSITHQNHHSRKRYLAHI